MGKQSGKKKNQAAGAKTGESIVKQNKGSENSPRVYDKDTAVFISMSQELKDEGNRLFQRRDYEGAMLKYEKALKLLPRNHIDVSYLRSNTAACYMQMGLSEYPRAIHECNLALEVTPKYSKALLKRARCYEALNRLDLALRDVSSVLRMEPRNLMATEIAERIKATIEAKGIRGNDIPIELVPVPEYIEPRSASASSKVSKEKIRKKKSNKSDVKNDQKTDEKEAENKLDNEKAEEQNNTDHPDKYEEVEHKIKKEHDKVITKEKNTDDKIKQKNVKGKMKEKEAEEKIKEKNAEKGIEGKKAEDKTEEKSAEDKLVVEEIIRNTKEKEPKRTVKLVLGEDIRWAQIPVNCSILKLREVILDRFPKLEAVLIKYRDPEGDLVTIMTSEELRWAEACAEHGSIRLYLAEVDPEQDPLFDKLKKSPGSDMINGKQNKIISNGTVGRKNCMQNDPCIDDWIIQFAQLFKNHVGFDYDAYLNLHEVGSKLYSEAMEETVTSEEAQDIFAAAAGKFQEMAALAVFYWGNIHMSRARKKVYFPEDSSRESILALLKSAYDWAQHEYSEAGERYEEALKIKPDFYESILALGQLQFEKAKLAWYYAVGTNVNLESWPSTEVLQLYNKAEENMERGMQMWEDVEERRQDELSNSSKINGLLHKMKLDGLSEHVSTEVAAEQAASMRSQINLLWGTMLYERSIMEFKLGLPVWHECLEVSIEKFELAGASPTDIAVMIKNHCSNDTAVGGFNVDEIVQAWNEMYEAKRLQSGVPSFRLESLLRRRVSKLYHVLEHA